MGMNECVKPILERTLGTEKGGFASRASCFALRLILSGVELVRSVEVLVMVTIGEGEACDVWKSAAVAGNLSLLAFCLVVCLLCLQHSIRRACLLLYSSSSSISIQTCPGG